MKRAYKRQLHIAEILPLLLLKEKLHFQNKKKGPDTQHSLAGTIHMAVCQALWGLWWHMCDLFLSTGKSMISIPWGNSIFLGTCSGHESMRLLVLEQCWWRGCYPAPMQAQLLLANSKHFLHLLATCLSILGTSRGSTTGINPHLLRIASGRGWVGMGKVWQLTTSTHC